MTKSGTTRYELMSGAADIEQARPITPHSVFHIASLSKQITAATVAHAVSIACFSNNPLDSCEAKVLKVAEILAEHGELGPNP